MLASSIIGRWPFPTPVYSSKTTGEYAIPMAEKWQSCDLTNEPQYSGNGRFHHYSTCDIPCLLDLVCGFANSHK